MRNATNKTTIRRQGQRDIVVSAVDNEVETMVSKRVASAQRYTVSEAKALVVALQVASEQAASLQKYAINDDHDSSL